MTIPTETDDMNDGESGAGDRVGAIVKPLRDGIDTALAHANDAADVAREKAAKAIEVAKGGIGQARETIGDAYTAGLDKAADAYATARERARLASESATGTLDTNPIIALLGGLAAGVAIGALLPRTEREAKLLGGLGDKLNALGREVADAAKDAGRAKLAEIGLTPDKARESLHMLIDGALAAATSAGSAAAEKAGVRPAGEAAR